MSKRPLQERLDRAVRKRDKWASRVSSLEKQAGTISIPIAKNDPLGVALLPLPVDRGVPEEVRRGFGPGRKYSGICTQVAKQLSLTSKYVMYVAKGGTLDARTLAALLEAAAQRDRQLPTPPPFTQEQLQAFSRGGRYFGVLSHVSRTMGISSSFPTLVARGKSRSASVLKEIQKRVAEIDSQVAGQAGGAVLG